MIKAFKDLKKIAIEVTYRKHLNRNRTATTTIRLQNREKIKVITEKLKNNKAVGKGQMRIYGINAHR